jgi:hypothetical protein
MVGLLLFYLGIVALIPFVSGLLGFSRLTAYLMTAVLVCGSIYLDAVTFSDALKFQPVYRLPLIRVGTTALLSRPRTISNPLSMSQFLAHGRC